MMELLILDCKKKTNFFIENKYLKGDKD